MTSDEAKEILSWITTEWHKGKLRGEGSKREVGRRYWSDRGISQPFDDWFRNMIYMASKDRGDNGVKRNTAKGEISYKERYRQMALKLDRIPSDRQLSVAWGADVMNKLSGVRYRLKPEGFLFEKGDNGDFIVAKRPGVPTPRVTAGFFDAVEDLLPSTPQPKSASDPGEQTRDVLRQGFAKLHISDNEHAQIGAEIIQELRAIRELMTELCSLWRA